MTDRITLYQTTFGREWRAHCDCCGAVFVVWDDDDLNAHNETCQCANPTHKETR